ncbi:MAG: photosystem II cytochrome c-550 [Cyanobacteria bacterium P01_F01_bin.53]
MFKRCTGLLLAAVILVSGVLGFGMPGAGLFAGEAIAAELDATIRTIKADDAGDTVTLPVEDFLRGRKKFNAACASCHVAGITKTNPNVGLDTESLEGAFPARDNIAALVDYLHNPTTYDGLVDISELHPSTKSSDIFPKMRNLTEDDLEAISAHILVMPKILGDKWGAGKTKSI